MTKRVWIELERPSGITDEEAEEHCRLANNLMRRLYKPEHVKEGRDWFWWDSKKRCYNVTIDEAGGFMNCADNGHWFSLEYLGRDE